MLFTNYIKTFLIILWEGHLKKDKAVLVAIVLVVFYNTNSLKWKYFSYKWSIYKITSDFVIYFVYECKPTAPEKDT